MLQRGGKLVAYVVPNTTQAILENIVKKHVHRTATLYTDEWQGYNNLSAIYEHKKVFHAWGQYSHDDVTTNRIENFWSQLKRVIGATYYRVTRKHLQSYVDECVFRYNVKGISVIEKMNMAIVNCRSRLTYKD